MQLVRITSEKSRYDDQLALVSETDDGMVILSEDYLFDYYLEERVPIYSVLAVGEEIVKVLIELSQINAK